MTLTPESVKLGGVVWQFIPYSKSTQHRERYVGEDGRGHYRMVTRPPSGGYYQAVIVQDIDVSQVQVLRREFQQGPHGLSMRDVLEWVTADRIKT